MPQLLTKEECQVDVCVLGTGLTESLTAAAFARHGQKVLHLDRSGFYGGCTRSLNLNELEAWANGASGEEPFEEPLPDLAEELQGLKVVPMSNGPYHGCFKERSFVWDPFGKLDEQQLEEVQTSLRRSSSSFSIDLVPRLLFGRSDLVDVLIESGVARYLEFQGLKTAKVLTEQGLASVPLTKSDIFQDPVLTLPEKRALMRFVTSTAPFAGSLAFTSPAKLGVDQARKVPAPSEPTAGVLEGTDPEEPFQVFLERQKLSRRLQEFLMYAICLWDWAPRRSGAGAERPCLSVREGLERLGRFISSIGLHGRGSSIPLLYPMYGIAEMAQGFTRICALHRGVYALRTVATSLVLQSSEQGAGFQAVGVVTQRGEVIRAKSIIATCDHLLHPSLEEEQSSATEEVSSCRRLTVLLDSPLLGEEGVNLCVVPPGALDPPLDNVVQVLLLDSSTGACPRGRYIAHLSQAWLETPASSSSSAADPDAGQPHPFSDLNRVLERLLKLREGQQCLFRCSYLHHPRRTRRWAPQAADAEALDTACSSHSLVVMGDPPAVPQLLASQEVTTARSLFLESPAHNIEALPQVEDFLKKPEHVVQEERGNAMEELELFMEQMQEVQEGRQVQLPLEHIEADEADVAPAAPDREENATESQ